MKGGGCTRRRGNSSWRGVGIKGPLKGRLLRRRQKKVGCGTEQRKSNGSDLIAAGLGNLHKECMSPAKFHTGAEH